SISTRTPSCASTAVSPGSARQTESSRRKCCTRSTARRWRFTFMTIDAVLMPAAMAAAAGLIGCFALVRRMTLAADALSHVALPGIGIALALHVNPVIGAPAMLFFGAVLVWAVEDRARLATETVIGVLFSAALAAGSLITSGEDLLDALFGRPSPISS